MRAVTREARIGTAVCVRSRLCDRRIDVRYLVRCAEEMLRPGRILPETYRRVSGHLPD